MARVNCRSDPKCASMGWAQDALVGVKQSSTLFLAAHRRFLLPLWADRLSRMTWIAAPSGRGRPDALDAARL